MTNSDLDFIKKDKIVQHTVNGISRFLILWIIKSSGSIHGYGVMKFLVRTVFIIFAWMNTFAYCLAKGTAPISVVEAAV